MATENSSLVSDIYQSRNNLINIMEERGFKVDEYDNFSITEVNAMTKNEQLDLLLENEQESKGKIYIKYNLTKGLRPQNVDDMVEELFELENILNKNDELLIITKMEPNETLEKHLEKIWLVKQIYVNILCINRLRFNLLKHSYVPKHELVDKSTIRDQYNIQRVMLPIYPARDKQAHWPCLCCLFLFVTCQYSQDMSTSTQSSPHLY